MNAISMHYSAKYSKRIIIMIKIKFVYPLNEITLPLPLNVHRILHGNCLLFAKILKRKLGPSAKLKAFMINEGDIWILAHVVVEFNGKYYDGTGEFDPEKYYQYQSKKSEDDGGEERFFILDYHPLRWNANLNNGPDHDDDELEEEYIYQYNCNSRQSMLRQAIRDEGGKLFPQYTDEANRLATEIAKRIKNKNI